MITSKEARELVRVYSYNERLKLLDYITQQEKVNELLGLYRSAIKGCPSHVPLGILKDIDKLESELNDRK